MNTIESVRNKALLVDVSIDTPGQTRTDEDVTREVHHKHGSSHDSGAYVAHLYSKTDLAPWKTEVGRLSNYLRQPPPCGVTFPFAAGLRLMPSAVYFEAGERAGRLIKEAYAVADKITSRFDEIMEAAKQRHAKLYRPEWYPKSPGEFRSQFRISLNFFPIPEGRHFVLDMVDDVTRELATGVDKQVEESIRSVNRNLIVQMLKPVQHMAKILKEKKVKIFDSLVGNIREMLEIVPKYNLLDDQEIKDLAREIELTLIVETEDLRKHKTFRKRQAEEADRLAAKLAAYTQR